MTTADTVAAAAAEMRVRKRDGRLEPVNLDKIVKAIRRCADNLTAVDPMRVAVRTIGGLYDGAPTQELDRLAIQTAAALVAEEPEYSKLAARLLRAYIEKEVVGQDIHSFSQSIAVGATLGFVSADTAAFVAANARKLNNAVNNEPAPDAYEYFGLKTVYDRYLRKTPATKLAIETPAYWLMRVACGLSATAADAVEFFRLISSHRYMPSTPTLFNSGTRKSQMSSCYLLDSPLDTLTGDDRTVVDGIYKGYVDIARLSKFAGGIGVAYHRVRSRNSHINGTGGDSNGVVPWLRVLDASVAAVDQGGRRKGAAAVYLETHHADVTDFLELNDEGGDINRRAYNLNLANWVPDIFMRRVRAGESWSLFDPAKVPHLCDLWGDAYDRAYEAAEAAGLADRTIPARDLYARMMKTLAETGNGWMTFKDACNRKSSQTALPENVVHSSNLCVAPETMVLTSNGQLPIASLTDKTVEVWNGSSWSSVVVRQTSPAAPLVEVELSNGVTISCTPGHKFILSSGVRVSAKDLQPGARLTKFDLPVVDGGTPFAHAYTHGFYCGDGYDHKDRKWAWVYGPKQPVLQHLSTIGHVTYHADTDRHLVQLPDEMADKFVVPVNADLAARTAWFAGLCDADATIAWNGDNASLQLASVREDFLQSVRLLLQTLGVDSKIAVMMEAGDRLLPDGHGGKALYPCQKSFRLLVTSVGLSRLLAVGVVFRRLSTERMGSPNRASARFVTVKQIVDRGRVSPTYCFSEPLRHAGVFNGVLTGQCTEITEVTSPTQTAVCLAGGTPVLTSVGIVPIEKCDGLDVYVPFAGDNDFTASPRFVRATLIDNGVRETSTVKLADGREITGTKDHRFLVRLNNHRSRLPDRYEWRQLGDLREGDLLAQPPSTAVVACAGDTDDDWLTVGWMLGDGWQRPTVYGVCFGPKETVARDRVMPVIKSWFDKTTLANKGVHDNFPIVRVDRNGVYCWATERRGFLTYVQQRFGITTHLAADKTLPENLDLSDHRAVRSFLGGLFSADGHAGYDSGKIYVALTSASETLLHQTRSALTAYGVHGRIRFAKRPDGRRWGILQLNGGTNVDNFRSFIGFPLAPDKQRLLDACAKADKHTRTHQFVRVKRVTPSGHRRVFDLTLPEGHHFLAGGVVVHNCNLGSLNLGKFASPTGVDFIALATATRTAVRYLDRVIDKNFYPTVEAEASNARWRPIGLGCMGLQDVFFTMRLPFDSREALDLSTRIAEEIYYYALLESCALAEELGRHPAFDDTRAAKGELQFDLWDKPNAKPRWQKLKERIKQHGLRNSLVVAIAPTATIASIVGAYECIEPQVNNLFKRETLSGEFLQVNRYLVADLKRLGLWTQETRNHLKAANGSVQTLPGLPDDLKLLYRTAWELPQRALIDLAAARGPYVDQSQSVNLFVSQPTIGKLSSMYMYAWESGLKTTYYLRSRKKTEIAKTTVQPVATAPAAAAVACSLENPESCESCQ